jgi:hypothetical protein
MAQDVLEKIKKESEPLYLEVLRTAGKKWDVIGFEKVSPELYIIKVCKVKKPDNTFNVKCILHNSRWFLVGEK